MTKSLARCTKRYVGCAFSLVCFLFFFLVFFFPVCAYVNTCALPRSLFSFCLLRCCFIVEDHSRHNVFYNAAAAAASGFSVVVCVCVYVCAANEQGDARWMPSFSSLRLSLSLLPQHTCITFFFCLFLICCWQETAALFCCCCFFFSFCIFLGSSTNTETKEDRKSVV